MKQCAFLTVADRGEYTITDHLAIEPLRLLNWETVEVPWNAPGVDWARFDAVVIRSTWDYHEHAERYLSVLGEIEAETQLFNPCSICAWNLDKRYLRDLESRGVPIVPTIWLDRLEVARIPELFSHLGQREIVAKPTVGANAHGAFVLRESDPAAWGPALTLLRERACLAQPFVHSVVEEGEVSLFYFGGVYSHAVLKTPGRGDFRVQEEHGGSVCPVSAVAGFEEAGRRALDALPRPLLYARVDLVRLADGTAAVMELELIEPSLYFTMDERAPRRFASALEMMAG
jgi:hypothetical protein